jgi:uncharacterized protein YndB with AHSA1/START domain
MPQFVISRLFDAPIQRVFEAWADIERYAQWSGPKGSRVHILSGAIAAGSHLHSTVVHPDLPIMYTWCAYREIDRPRRIVWEQSFADAEGNITGAPFFEHWPRKLLTELDFIEKDGGTELTLRWTPIEATPEAIEMFVKQMTSMKGGWGGSFDELEAYLAD